MATYPQIGTPKSLGDGTFSVTIRRGPGDDKVRTFEDEKTAVAYANALRQTVADCLPEIRKSLPVSSIKGPSWDKQAGRWDLRWVEGDERRCKTSTEKSELLAKRDELERRQGKVKVKIPKLPHGRKFDINKIEHQNAARNRLTEALWKATMEGDTHAQAVLKKANTAFESMCQGAERARRQAELEQLVQEAVTFVEKLYRGEVDPGDAEKPAVTRSLAHTLRARAGSGSTVH